MHNDGMSTSLQPEALGDGRQAAVMAALAEVLPRGALLQRREDHRAL